MYDNVITLIEVENTVDEYGDKITSKTEKEIYAEVKSIGTTEFYQAQATGLRPEVKFVIPDYNEYSGEKIVKWENEYGKTEEYSVIRTYRNGRELEITCKRGIE